MVGWRYLRGGNEPKHNFAQILSRLEKNIVMGPESDVWAKYLAHWSLWWMEIHALISGLHGFIWFLVRKKNANCILEICTWTEFVVGIECHWSHWLIWPICPEYQGNPLPFPNHLNPQDASFIRPYWLVLSNLLVHQSGSHSWTFLAPPSGSACGQCQWSSSSWPSRPSCLWYCVSPNLNIPVVMC